jgi:pimeloyl-ACP methyl ester carboxylesterase
MSDAVYADVTWEHASSIANGVEIHHATAGCGEPVLMIPGWPQTWFAWRKVAARLIAAGRRAIVVDPRGTGRSGKAQSGYSFEEAATDIHDLIGHLGLASDTGVDILSHDLGSAIAHTLACRWPSDVRRLVLSEVAIPKFGQSLVLPDQEMNLRSWHFAFNRLPDLPELLIAGRERAYLDFLWNTKATRPEAIEDAARVEYAETLAQPGAAKASFDYYRAAFSDIGLQQMAARFAMRLSMPVLAIGADGGVGTRLADSLENSADDLRSVLAIGCGHYIPEEDPDFFVASVLDFWASTDRP